MKRISALLIVLLTASVSVLFAQETHAQWKAEVEQLDKNLYRVSMRTYGYGGGVQYR